MSKKIIILGETCRDIFIYGDCPRLCPEAPVPIFIPTKTEENGGMAKNVYNNIKSLAPKDYLIEGFYPETREIVKTRYVDNQSGQILIRVDENDKVGKINIYDFIHDFTIFDALVISSYNKGFLNTQDINLLTNYAHNCGAVVFADHKYILGSWSKDIDYVKINKKEFDAQGEYPERYCRNLIVTNGEKGATLTINDKPPVIVNTEKIKVSCVSGCGDSFLSTLVVAILRGYNIEESIRYSNKASGLAASQRGVATIDGKDVFPT